MPESKPAAPEQESAPGSNVRHPARALPKRYVEAILYLADRMADADHEVAGTERRIINELALCAKIKDFRKAKWYRQMSDQAACDRLEADVAKNGAMVVMTLVLKADLKKRPEEHQYFTRIRQLLGAPPIVVPVEVEAHRALAREYMGG
jgi:hypothetical protein